MDLLIEWMLVLLLSSVSDFMTRVLLPPTQAKGNISQLLNVTLVVDGCVFLFQLRVDEFFLQGRVEV